MPEDWWSAASNAAAASAASLSSSFARINSSATGAARASPQPKEAGGDPLLAGLTRAGSRPAAPAGALPAPRHERAGSGGPGIVLYELVERATGHGREGLVDAGAQRRVLASVRAQQTPVADVLRAVVAGSDALADAAYNASVLHFVHLLLDAGPRALGEASAGSSGKAAPAMRVVADVHRASRRGGDLLSDDPLRAALAASPVPEGRASLAAGGELYALLLSRKLMFAARAPEVEANYSVDRWYRRLGIEKVADETRDEANATRRAALITPECAAELLGIVRIAIATLAALRRGRASKDILAAVVAEACNAYVFAEYVRAKNEVRVPPREVAKGLRDVLLGIAADWKREMGARNDCVIAEVVANGAGVDLQVAKDVLAPSGPVEKARATRVESRHRRDIVCSFTSFSGLHQAMNPALKVGRTQAPNVAGAV